MWKIIFSFLLSLIPFYAFAQNEVAPKFHLPLACVYGQNCWVMNYTDTGPVGDGKAVDPGCLNRTYQDHKGTDFEIADERAMKQGVSVLAAQAGTVTRARDGEKDQWSNEAQLQKIRAEKRDCGNAVLIDHGDGWQTMYCHMKEGSIAVKAGQKVKMGDKLGEVGLSGYTQFPHVHFGITHGKEIIDPFTGVSIDQPCGKNAQSLWDPSVKISYEALAIRRTGFDTKEPSLGLLDHGEKPQTVLYAAQSPSLVYYVVFNGARLNDQVDLKIYGPDDKIFAEHSVKQDQTRNRQLLYVGRKTDQILLRKGKYRGTVLITRIYEDGTKQRWTEEDTIDVK